MPAVLAQTSDSRTAPAKPKGLIIDRTIHVEARVPDGAWNLTIEEIWRVRSELWVFVRVERPEHGMGAMMICTAEDDATARLPDLPTRIFIVGKTWAWKNTEPVEWIKSNADVFQQRREGSRVWRHPREE